VVGTGLLIVTLISQAAKKLFRDDRDISFDVRGDLIVFNAAGEGERDLFLLDLRTREVKPLTRSSAREFAPRFAPDGQQVVYAAYPSSDIAKPSSIYSLDLRSNQVVRLTNSPFADYNPRYLPDGKTLLFGRAHRLRPYSLGGTVWDKPQTYLLDVSSGTVYSLGVFFWAYEPLAEGALLVKTEAEAHLLNIGAFRESLSEQDAEKNKQQVTAHMKQDELSSFLTNLQHNRSSTGDLPISFHEFVLVEGGRALVFLGIAAGSGYDYELWYVRRDGTGLRRLTRLHTYLECLRYDPAGNFVYFLRLENPMGMVKSLWRLHLPTGRLEKVADADLFSDPLGYSKREKRIR